MKDLRWRGIVTDRGHFFADEHKGFVALMRSLHGEDVEITVKVLRQQSAKKRGFFHAAVVPVFRVWLETRLRELVGEFREHYGEFTLDHARDVLVRCAMNFPEDVDRVSTAIDQMDDKAYEDMLFRIEGLFQRIECPFPEAETDRVMRRAG